MLTISALAIAPDPATSYAPRYAPPPAAVPIARRPGRADPFPRWAAEQHALMRRDGLSNAQIYLALTGEVPGAPVSDRAAMLLIERAHRRVPRKGGQ